MIKRISRRTLLRGAAGVGIGLPLLEAMLPRAAHGATSTAPRRIMFVFQANGDQPSRRFIDTGETTFTFDEFLAPLEPYRKDLLLLNRLDRRYYKFAQNERADGHQQGGASLAPWKAGAGAFPIGGADRTVGYVLGPSADHEIGDRVLQANPSVSQRHLVFRVNTKENNIWDVSSHAGPTGQQNPVNPETDPYNAYTSLFAGDSKDPALLAALSKRIAMKQSALDNAIGEIGTLRAKLGTADQQRLDQHTQALRDIERSLSATSASACNPQPFTGPMMNVYDDTNHAALGQLFFKVSAWAFACDHTRSVNFNWSGNTSNRVYGNLGITDGHHDISHISDDAAFAKIRQIHKHLWEQSVTLHDLLKATPDGPGGTLWDNTLVVHWNELGQGDVHSENDALVVLAGGAGGHFKMGRLLDFNNKQSFADMLVSCFQYMGFSDVTSFGDPLLNTGGPLPNLTT
jgi:Protein of unknown function (DUF1552)